MPYVIGFLYALYGLLVGSFLNVCIYRIPRHIFWKSSHSFCPNCGRKLEWYELIPLFSWLFLGGRCRTCKEKINIRYPLVEGGNMLLWLAAYLVFGFGWYSIFLCLVFSIMLVISCIDLEIMEIPDGLVIALAVLGIAPFVASFFEDTGLPWWGYLVGIVAMSVPFFLVALATRGGIGGGDIKLLAAIGLFMGWKKVILGTVLGVVVGGIVGAVLLIIFGRNRRAMMPLAPSLCVGLTVALLWGDPIIDAFVGAITI